MEDKRVYLQPGKMVYNALLDLMELQNGEEIVNDPSYGKLRFRIVMYGFTWTLGFTVLEIDWNRCGVTLEAEEEEAVGDDDEELRYLKDMMRREYALLDSMLLIGTDEAACGEET